ncbi:MAG: aldehyde dehydrogenase (NAD+) [Flavobacteriaceae bacterium]|jgi:aldehyde dehydrogenase (NAD+)
MEKIVTAQRKFFASHATKDVKFRIEQLILLKSVIKDNEEQLNRAIYEDFKKSSFENYMSEISLIYADIDEALRKIKRWSKAKRVGTNLINLPGISYIIPEPLGVCLIIGAWNYPYFTSLRPVVAAIAAGNTVVLKPSEVAQHSSRAMHDILSKNFTANYITVIEGGVDETTQLLTIKFDKVFFTGSVSVGKIVYSAASKYLTPVTLELGGKNPTFVTESCHLKSTVQRLIWAKFLNTGQACVSPDYFLVHKSIIKEFIELAKKEIEKSKFSFENGNYVQIITEKHTERLINLIDTSKIVHGGDHNLAERYIEPTIIDNVTFDDPIMQEEVFGPLLPIIEYESLDAIIAKVNTYPKPLSCYVFTKDSATRNKILSEVSFGNGAVNDAIMQTSNPSLPFGGVGASGTGAYHGKFGFSTFSHYKGVLRKATWFETNLKYSPHNLKKMKWIKRIIGQK